MDPVVRRTHDIEGFVKVDRTLKLHFELYLPACRGQDRWAAMGDKHPQLEIENGLQSTP